jgi:hypothetical protein
VEPLVNRTLTQRNQGYGLTGPNEHYYPAPNTSPDLTAAGRDEVHNGIRTAPDSLIRRWRERI